MPVVNKLPAFHIQACITRERCIVAPVISGDGLAGLSLLGGAVWSKALYDLQYFAGGNDVA